MKAYTLETTIATMGLSIILWVLIQEMHLSKSIADIVYFIVGFSVGILVAYFKICWESSSWMK